MEHDLSGYTDSVFKRYGHKNTPQPRQNTAPEEPMEKDLVKTDTGEDQLPQIFKTEANLSGLVKP